MHTTSQTTQASKLTKQEQEDENTTKNRAAVRGQYLHLQISNGRSEGENKEPGV